MPSNKGASILIILVLSFILLALTIIAVRLLGVGNFFTKGPKTIVQLITNTGLKSDNNRINVLLLGIGGEGHDGPYLTDTMMLVSIDKNSHDVALISIPRDIWIQSLNGKINSAYAFGWEKDKTGLALAEKTVSDAFNIPVHYGARVDFSGFEKAVNLVGGLDIDVDNTFSDYRYPIEGKENELCGIQLVAKKDDPEPSHVYFKDATGSAQLLTEDNDPFTCRYETLTFRQGPTHMDGVTALKYVRSRHGTGDEGSDFARSARQQKVILAFRQKVLSTQTLLNPKKVIDLLTTFGNSIDTDITNDDIPLFANIAKKVDPSNIRRIVLDSGRPESVLDVGDPAQYSGAFALIPKNNDWQTLQNYIKGEIFNPSPSPGPSK